MVLIKEIKTFGFGVFLEGLIMQCKAFEDNYVAIELVRLPKVCPHNKHINVVFHHFREYVRKLLIHIQQVSKNDHCADAWTKTLPQNVILKHRKIIFGL